MAVIVDVPRIRVDDLVAGGDIRALTDVATVQHSVWGETRMFWLAPTYVVLRDTGGYQDLFRAAVHRPEGYDTARLYMHVTGTGGGTHSVRITIDGDTNTYSVPHATPSEFFVPLVSTSDIQPVLVEVDIDGTGSNDYTVTMCIVLDDVPFPEPPAVLTFGSASADYLTWYDLPVGVSAGRLAVDVRSDRVYQSVVAFGRAWWLPREAAEAGAVIYAACDGAEPDDTALLARGFVPSINIPATLTHAQTEGHIFDTTLAGAGSIWFTAPNLHASGLTASTVWGGMIQSQVLTLTGAIQRRAFDHRDQTRQYRLANAGLTGTTAALRFTRDGTSTVTEVNNWLNAIGTFETAATSDTVEFGFTGSRMEARLSGRSMIAAGQSLFGSAGTANTWQTITLLLSSSNGTRAREALRMAVLWYVP